MKVFSKPSMNDWKIFIRPPYGGCDQQMAIENSKDGRRRNQAAAPVTGESSRAVERLFVSGNFVGVVNDVFVDGAVSDELIDSGVESIEKLGVFLCYADCIIFFNV